MFSVVGLTDDPPRPVHDDILIAKLKPGQRIKVEGWCRCAGLGYLMQIMFYMDLLSFARNTRAHVDESGSWFESG